MSATKRPNQPWPGAAEAFTDARAALVAAGLSAERVTENPRALLGPIVALRVEVGDGHVVATLGRCGCGEPAQWTAGLLAWHPRRMTFGLPTMDGERMPTAAAALASTLAWAMAQPWPSEAESAMILGMLERLRAAEVVR
jgi:hypothetical protein